MLGKVRLPVEISELVRVLRPSAFLTLVLVVLELPQAAKNPTIRRAVSKQVSCVQN